MLPTKSFTPITETKSLASPTVLGTYNDDESDEDDEDNMPDLTSMMPPQMQIQQALLKLTELHNDQKKLRKQLKKQQLMIQQINQPPQSTQPYVPPYVQPIPQNTASPNKMANLSTHSHMNQTNLNQTHMNQSHVNYPQPYAQPPTFQQPTYPQPPAESDKSLEFYKMQHEMMLQLIQSMNSKSTEKDKGISDLEKDELLGKINKLTNQLEKLKSESKFNEYPAFAMTPGYMNPNMYRGSPPYNSHLYKM